MNTVEDPLTRFPAGYGDGSPLYTAVGWQGVLPVPPRTKQIEIVGFTGRQGAWPTRSHIEHWRRAQPDANTALRLPSDVLGIDVDIYRAQNALAELEAFLGQPLPPTWSSTSRADGSGIRLYRVPPAPKGKRWACPVPGVDIIRYEHRYVIVWPSIHPSGAPYRWVDLASGEIADRPPSYDDLTELPFELIPLLLEDDPEYTERPPVDFDLADGEPSGFVAQQLAAGIEACRGRQGSRHDAVRDRVAALVRLGERGEVGVPRALAQLESVFVAAVASDRPGGEGHARAEFEDMVNGARRIVAGTVGEMPTREERDEWRRIEEELGAMGPSSNGTDTDEEPPDESSLLINWPEFWAQDLAGEDWLAEPILPRGRQIVLYAKAKAGKSLLTLDIAAALATGRPLLGRPATPPITVLYLDYEMAPADLQERLEDLGYGPDVDLSRLKYALFPSIDPLNTAAGAQSVVKLVKETGAELVIVDTTVRAVVGEESSADTIAAFYRHTGMALKALGVTLLRNDHAGKDLEKGQRGSSAKVDDVDLVWYLKATDDGVELQRTHQRVSWVPQRVALTRQTEPCLAHLLAPRSWPAGTAETAVLLDKLGAPSGMSVRKAKILLREGGEGRRTDVVSAALRYRMESAENWPGEHGEHHGEHF